MAGKYVHPDKKTTPPKIETLSCPKCGGAITLRAKGYTQTLVCQYCQTILDVAQSELTISGAVKSKDHIEPLIPLGTRGKLHGATWEVIGFMQRMGTFPAYINREHSVSVNVKSLLSMALDVDDNDHYTPPAAPLFWQEYLLFNPYKGFRWLSERNGHWNYIFTLHDIPKEGYGQFQYLDVNYKYYETYEANVLYVAGEFYWRIKTGDVAKITDYKCKTGILSLEEAQSSPTRPSRLSTKLPPEREQLYIGGTEISRSSEEQNKEQIWSLAEYIEREEVMKAFQLTKPLPMKIGVAFNQPVPDKESYQTILKTSGLGVVALIFISIFLSFFSHPKSLLDADFIIPQINISTDYVSPSFIIDTHNGVVKLALQAPVNQSWMEIEASLVNDKTGESIDIQKGLEYYSGSDYDGYWVEGSRYGEMTFTSPEKGQYHIILKATTNNLEPLPVKIQLVEGVTSFDNFIFSLLLLGAPGALVLLYFLFIEMRREK